MDDDQFAEDLRVHQAVTNVLDDDINVQAHTLTLAKRKPKHSWPSFLAPGCSSGTLLTSTEQLFKSGGRRKAQSNGRGSYWVFGLRCRSRRIAQIFLSLLDAIDPRKVKLLRTELPSTFPIST